LRLRRGAGSAAAPAGSGVGAGNAGAVTVVADAGTGTLFTYGTISTLRPQGKLACCACVNTPLASAETTPSAMRPVSVASS
jgi:hypothetical protein